MGRCRGKYDLVVEEGFGGSRIPRLAPLYVKEPIITEWHQIHQALFEAQYPKIMVPFLNLLERSVAYLHRNTLVRAGTVEWQEAFPSIGFRKGNVFVVPVRPPTFNIGVARWIGTGEIYCPCTPMSPACFGRWFYAGVKPQRTGPIRRGVQRLFDRSSHADPAGLGYQLVNPIRRLGL